MDLPSSRFQKLLTAAITEARAEKLNALATSLCMAGTKFEDVKQQAGVIQAYDAILDVMQGIEQKLSAEARG